MLHANAKKKVVMLNISGLEAGYGAIQILWGVDLRVDEGEIVALIGSNGAGKTTLLNVISGLVPARAGTISFKGASILNASSDTVVNLGLTHVPQGRRLFPGLTVKENIMQGAYRRKGDKAGIKASYDEMLALFPALEVKLKDAAGKLSGGQQQMVAIARGLMSVPDLLFIDELSLGLAPKIVDDILVAVQRINRERGTALLIVEQDVEASLRHASRGYVLETGRILKTGDAADLLDDEDIKAAYLGL
jgi:branched-chain amino acid transport system ATP-binding protein